MAGEPRAFEEIREWAEQEAGPEAGKDGVLENDLFRGQLLKTPENDSKVKDYLRRLAFTPSWRFTRRFEITRDMLVPWPALREWIPQRVAWWLTRI
jgi:putative hydrolase of the HAD superfamily